MEKKDDSSDVTFKGMGYGKCDKCNKRYVYLKTDFSLTRKGPVPFKGSIINYCWDCLSSLGPEDKVDLKFEEP
jgi:hypothetical protein